MISEYNRTNPFLHVLQEKEKQLELSSTKTIKQLIFCGILSVIALVLTILRQILSPNENALSCFLTVFPIIFGVYFVREAFRHNRKAEINEIMLGDKFESINLNNEKLLSDSLSVTYAIGCMDQLYRMLSACNFFYLIEIVASILIIAVTAFR